jgi:glycosyltransferase involved in cell wall biosynthesis
VLFVSGPVGDGRRYRCDYQREQLERVGLRADVSYAEGLRLEPLSARYGTIVLQRVAWNDQVARLVEGAREHGATVLADVDDLVFDPDREHLMSGLDRLNASARRAYHDSIVGLRRTLSAVDGVMVSTEPLRDEVVALNERVSVAFNTVGSDMRPWAERARFQTDRQSVVVGYLSGTPTHDRDFLEAADAVLWALEKDSRVRLHVVGHVELDARFDAFGDRVVRSGPVPFRRLPDVLTRIDISLAPLEAGNAFTDCKSCIKYLEAGLLAVPTVASPRPDFARVIEHGANGLLADGPDSWRSALDELIGSPSRRAELGRAALDDVLARHTTAASAEATASAFRGLLR